MVSETPLSFSSAFSSSSRSPAPKLSNSFATRIFSDVAGDITILIDGESFLLHKFPLVARCGKIRKMVSEANDSNSLKTELLDFPGGPQTFELTMKFCYGINFEITTSNVARLRCASEYLQMTEDCREENLITRTEVYLNDVVFQSLEKSVEVLCSCETLPQIAEHVGVSERCVEAIAMTACKEQLVSGLSRLDCDAGSTEFKGSCPDWWVEDLSALRIDYYQRVIFAMGRTGIRPDSIVASLMHYSQESLKDIRKSSIWNPAKTKPDSGLVNNRDQRTIVEALVCLIPIEKSSSIPLNFLFGMLRVAIMVDASISCRLELERKISYRFETVSLDDLLIPAVRAADSLYDVDTVHRLLINFLQRMEDDDNEDCGYDSESGGSTGHSSLLKVGRLVDAYLAEIAPDPYLSLQKFIAMVEILPDYARVIDDGLYRAIDMYLKAHPSLAEHECKKLCKFIDCQKLSQEACNHAAQNDRLPVQMVVRVLYFEQIRLKNSLSESSGDGLLSQKISSGVPSGVVSPRDNYASLRRENREIKLEISRMRVRLSELEKEQMFMKEGMIDKSGNGKTFLTSISKGIGRIGIFGGPTGRKRHKPPRKSRGADSKTVKSRRHSVS